MRAKFKKGKARDRFWSKEEVSRLLSVCKNSKSLYLYPITLFALSSVARKGEIVGFKWHDINFARATVAFRDTKNGEMRTIPLRGCEKIQVFYIKVFI